MKNIYKVNEEAVKKIAERVYDNGSTVINRNDLEELFPELKESEDERIRKWIIAYLENRVMNTSITDEKDNCLNAIRWLEKQGEHDNFRNKIQIGDKVTRNEDGVLVNLSQLKRVAKKDEKQGEQKPVWSQEDEDILNTIINHFKIDIECTDEDDIVRWLKSLKGRVQPQPKQEWSLKEDAFIQVCVNAINDISYFRSEDKEELINWLKSLSPQPHWKPSDEQMRVLDLAIRCGINRGTTEETALVSLFNDLKKLKT